MVYACSENVSCDFTYVSGGGALFTADIDSITLHAAWLKALYFSQYFLARNCISKSCHVVFLYGKTF